MSCLLVVHLITSFPSQYCLSICLLHSLLDLRCPCYILLCFFFHSLSLPHPTQLVPSYLPFLILSPLLSHMTLCPHPSFLFLTLSPQLSTISLAPPGSCNTHEQKAQGSTTRAESLRQSTHAALLQVRHPFSPSLPYSFPYSLTHHLLSHSYMNTKMNSQLTPPRNCLTLQEPSGC